VNSLAYWKDKENQKAFFDKLSINWNIKKPEDWCKVTRRMVLSEGGKFIDTYYNGSLKRGKSFIFIVSIMRSSAILEIEQYVLL
jgi:hypothetical protein